jgi:hypothetical protein
MMQGQQAIPERNGASAALGFAILLFAYAALGGQGLRTDFALEVPTL